MTETKNKNGKSGVYQNSDLGASGVCHKIPDQVGDDGLIVGSACSKTPAFAGMTESSRGERGRSMVEMLGVLAVMGVLSIGGVAGYRYAIDKMNANDIINEVANDIINEVRKRAITASQQRVLGQNINLAEYGDNGRIKGIHAVTATNDYAGDKGFFALTVSAVPQRVCDEILKQDWAMPVATAVGGVVVDDDTTCADGENEMLFAFANTLDSSLIPGEGGGENGDDNEPELEPCGEGEYRENGDDNEPELEPCGEGEYRLSTGECITDPHTECADGEFYNGLTDSCTTCPTEGSPVQNDLSDMEDTCEKCVGSRYGVSALGTNECMTNDDCTGDNQYCQNDYGCEVTVGTCETISSTTVTINEKTYTASTDRMSYHAAENFCDALGKKLAPLTDGCTAEELAAVKANNYWGNCSGWAHTTGKHYWTATKLSGCSSYRVSSHSSGWVGSYNWTGDSGALCR